MKMKTRRVWVNGFLYTQFKVRKKWVFAVMGAKGAPKMPPRDRELDALNRKWLELAIEEATRDPNALELALEEMAKLSLEEQKRTLKEGPRIPEPFKQAIRQSFDVARGDVTKDITNTFDDFLVSARRELLGRGLGDQGSSLNADLAGFAAKEQGQLLETALSRLAAGQASAEVSGSMDMANMISQALQLSTGRAGEVAGRRSGLLSGGMNNATNYFNNQANMRMQAALAGAGGGGDMMGSIFGGMGAAGGVMAGLGALGFSM